MFERLISGTDWDYAVLRLKETNPMVLDRKVCNPHITEDHLIVHVDGGPHPVRNEPDITADADHYVPTSDIAGITYYKDKVKPKLVSLNKKIIAEA